MNISKLLILFTLSCIFPHIAMSQNLLKSRHTSEITRVYAISSDEAKKIFMDKKNEVPASYYHTQVDSFPTDSSRFFQMPRKTGYYLNLYVVNNQVQTFLYSVAPFYVNVVNNQTDLIIDVRDSLGFPVKNAKVNVDFRRIYYDKKTATYRLHKANCKGLLSVKMDGFTYYADLGKQYKNSCIKRAYYFTFYRTPLKFVWIPVMSVVMLPRDIYRSIRYHQAQGLVRWVSKPFKDIIESIDEGEPIGVVRKSASIFIPQYRYNFRNSRNSFIVTNKPMYRPKDTVMLKAWLIDDKGKLYKYPVQVSISNQYRTKTLKKALKPYRDGAYEYQFVLADSLDLKLDQYTTISLSDEYDVSESQTIQYKDYELKENSYELRAPQKIQYKGIPFKVELEGKMSSGLSTMDARAEIKIVPKLLTETFADSVYLADILLTKWINLKPNKPTEFVVPDSIFPNASLNYQVQVKFLTADNEIFTKSVDVSYFPVKQEFKFELLDTLVAITYLKNGKEEKAQTTLTGFDNFGNQVFTQTIQAPDTLALRPWVQYLMALNSNYAQKFNLLHQEALVECQGFRYADSVQLSISNPRNLDVAWFIYKGKKLYKRGSGKRLQTTIFASPRKNVEVVFTYIWGGQVMTETSSFPFQRKVLNIKPVIPRIVDPGQELEIECTITSGSGKPEAGVDLTAWALTSKFKNYQMPQIPMYNAKIINRKTFNRFSIQKIYNQNNYYKSLNWPNEHEFWKLDSIEYYRFTHPGLKLYTYRIPLANGKTEFAPYIMSKGNFAPIFSFTDNYVPKYYYFAHGNNPYSFAVDSNQKENHRLEFRLGKRQIMVDSVFIRKGYKTIISLEDTLYNNYTQNWQLPDKLFSKEIAEMNYWCIPIRQAAWQANAYILSAQKQFFPLNRLNSQKIIGPIAGNFDYTDYDRNFHYNDLEKEQGFEYEFTPKAIKMRQLHRNFYPTTSWAIPPSLNLIDSAITLADWKKDYDRRMRFFKYKQVQYDGGSAKINLTIDSLSIKAGGTNTFVLIYKQGYSTPYWVYSQNSKIFNLSENEKYKFVYLFDNEKAYSTPWINFGKAGSYYLKLKVKDEEITSDTLVGFIQDEIEDELRRQKEEELKKAQQHFGNIYSTYEKGRGCHFKGRVTDESKESIPGANIILVGTDNVGAITDLDGNYDFWGPCNFEKMLITFVGFESKSFAQYEVGQNMLTQLQPSVHRLDEVVVVGYGVQKKSLMTGSVSQVVSGKVAGLSVMNSPGASENIMVRGVSSFNSTNKPLIIIDGKVFEGDLSSLDPSLLVNMTVLKDEQATAIYGSRAANGVVLINMSTDQIAKLKKSNKLQDIPEEELPEGGTVRANFNDYAFWQPRLQTDKDGKVKFKVKFPDDITTWKANFVAIGNKKTGIQECQIRAARKVVAQLKAPRFFVAGDTVSIITKALNYSGDTLQVSATFAQDGRTISAKQFQLNDNVIDTTQIIAAKADTTQLSFVITNGKGKTIDGEKHQIPVFPVGVREAKGNFWALFRDTRIVIEPSPGQETNLYITASPLNILENETENLRNYPYLCNEQAASKLLALLSRKMIDSTLGRKFPYNEAILMLIKKLSDAYQPESGWGWWKGNPSVHWISNHVALALIQAKNAGYPVKISLDTYISQLVREMDKKVWPQHIINLNMLLKMGKTLNYRQYIDSVEKNFKLNFIDQCQLIEMKAALKLPFTLDTLEKYERQDVYGNVYFDIQSDYFLTNPVQTSLAAYLALKATGADADKLMRLGYYILTQRKTYGWMNTYESSRVISVLLPDMLKLTTDKKAAYVEIKGEINKTLTEWPFVKKMELKNPITVTKKGFGPVYVSSWTYNFNPKPQESGNNFKVKTGYYSNRREISRLKAGEPVTLRASISVQKKADYIMLEIPIPAGCSYDESQPWGNGECYRELFRNKVCIFYQVMNQGTYTAEVKLMPRFGGKFTQNPARVEMMYVPTFYGQTAIKKVEIK
jgi:alpha-2-macroglobulin